MSAASILDWGIQTSLSVSLLILFVLIIRRPVARYLGASAAYALWALPLLRLIMPEIPILPKKSSVMEAVLPSMEQVGEIALGQNSVAPVTSGTIGFNWAGLFIILWLAGAIVWSTRQVFLQTRFNSKVKSATGSVSQNIIEKTENLAGHLGIKRLPEIKQLDGKSGPMITGLIQPVIVLPVGFETDFSSEQQTHALVHELSHLRNGDLWVAAAALVFRAVNWPNPLVHLAIPLFRADQEAACDARVIAVLGDDRSTKTAYANTLVRAAKLSNNNAQMLPLGLTISNPLKERLMILKSNPSQKRSLRLALGGTAALALLATAPLTTAQTPTPPATPQTNMADSMVEKKVMKWVTNENGVEVTKHMEIITENGVTTAWEIDELGNRMEVSVDSLNMPLELAGADNGNMRVIVKQLGEGHSISEADIEALIGQSLSQYDIEGMTEDFAGQRRVIVKSLAHSGDMDIDIEDFMGEHGDGKQVVIMENHDFIDFENEGENSFVFHSGSSMESEPGMMVGVASKMLDGVNTDDLDYNARAKVEAAQKALREAQEALAAAE